MLHQHAQFENVSVSIEAGVMNTRMETGKFKVFGASPPIVLGRTFGAWMSS